MRWLFFLCIPLIFIPSCRNSVLFPEEKPENNYGLTAGGDTVLARSYFEDGSIKSISQTVNGVRNGLTKNFYKGGGLLSEICYRNGLRHGTATDYYRDGKVHMRFNYYNNRREGDVVWYYPSGKPYRVTPYLHDQIHGVQRIYYESGQLQAEVPWENGQKGIGLREYTSQGKLKPTPAILVEEERFADVVFLWLTLSDGNPETTFYLGKLTKGKYLNHTLMRIEKENGKSRLKFRTPSKHEDPVTFDLVAVAKTSLGNELILKRSYTVKP